MWRYFQVALVVKNPPASIGDTRSTGLIPGSGRFPGEGNGNPLQYSCLENLLDRKAWWATVYGVANSWTQLSTSLQHISRLINKYCCLTAFYWFCYRLSHYIKKLDKQCISCLGQCLNKKINWHANTDITSLHYWQYADKCRLYTITSLLQCNDTVFSEEFLHLCSLSLNFEYFWDSQGKQENPQMGCCFVDFG